MKNKILMALLAASMIGSGNAATTYNVTSNITGLQLWGLGMETEFLTDTPGGYFSDVRFGGTATDVDGDGHIDSSQISISGVVVFVANESTYRQTYALSDGRYVAGSGTTFESGYIWSDIQNAGDGDWVPYGSYYAEGNFFEMVVGEPIYDGWNPGSSQITAGLQLALGDTALPGLWDGIVGSAGYNNAIATYTYVGVNMGLFMQGTVTLTPVPLPAGIWLFASGLIGLARMGHQRRAKG